MYLWLTLLFLIFNAHRQRFKYFSALMLTPDISALMVITPISDVFFLPSEIGKLHITLGIVYGTNEVCQFAIAGIMVRFGAFLVSVPNEHKFHATLVNILV